MFTGIIEDVGAVTRRSGHEVEILAEELAPGLALGESVSVDGACLTVAAKTENSFVVQVSPESFERTTLGRLQPGHAVNLERAMRADDRLGGHFVQGHVDGVGRIERVDQQGEFATWHFRAPDEVARYLAPKGSIAIDGISLTIVEPKGDRFKVAIIPTTLAKTTLSAKRSGDPVNMEADMLAKHIFHFMKQGQGGLTQEMLERTGFEKT